MLTVAINCAQQAAKTGVKRFVHVSTAQIYNSDKASKLINFCCSLHFFICLCNFAGH